MRPSMELLNGEATHFGALLANYHIYPVLGSGALLSTLYGPAILPRTYCPRTPTLL